MVNFIVSILPVISMWNFQVFVSLLCMYLFLFLGMSKVETAPLTPASPDGSAVWSVVVSTRWWLLVDHCVLRNWDRILVRAVKGLISRAGMVSIWPLLWQRDVKLQQTKPSPHASKKQKKCGSCHSFLTDLDPYSECNKRGHQLRGGTILGRYAQRFHLTPKLILPVGWD